MGYDGLIDGEFRPLTRQSSRTGYLTPTAEVEAMGRMGGTVPGSSRCARFFTREGRAEAVRQMEKYSITGMIVIGGLALSTAPTSSPRNARLISFAEVLEETRALMDGTSAVTMDRVRRMEAIQGVLAL